jgi:threonine/homoserine/homoserine lactone efflux protein
VDIPFLLKGIILGFSIAAPVGPIGVLCIRRTLAEGRIAGLVSGLGAATADLLYGCVAGFGLTFISQFLIDQELWLRLVGGLFLIYLGIRTFLSTGSNEEIQNQKSGLWSAYFTTFILTLTNPLTILSFAAIFAGLGIVNTGGDYASALLLITGVFTGSAFWWFLLSAGASFFQKKIDSHGLAWINRISGIIILVFGIIALGGIFLQKG